MDCPSKRNGICEIATQLAGVAVRPDARACEVCSQSRERHAENDVTLDLAIYYCPVPNQRAVLRQRRNPQMRAIAAGTGPGSQLWRLLESLGIRHTATCPCLMLAERMNAWGPAGCRLARAEIVDQMRINAKQYGWGTVAKAAAAAVRTGLAWRLDLADLYGSLLDEAIRRAEASDALPIVPPQA